MNTKLQSQTESRLHRQLSIVPYKGHRSQSTIYQLNEQIEIQLEDWICAQFKDNDDELCSWCRELIGLTIKHDIGLIWIPNYNHNF